MSAGQVPEQAWQVRTVSIQHKAYPCVLQMGNAADMTCHNPYTVVNFLATLRSHIEPITTCTNYVSALHSLTLCSRPNVVAAIHRIPSLLFRAFRDDDNMSLKYIDRDFV